MLALRNMLSLKNETKTSPPVVPVYWFDETKKHKIYWDTQREYWLGFMQRINEYCDGNGIGRPPESAVEDQICQQFPQWACTGDRPQNVPAGVTYQRSGCSACGRRG